MSKARLIITAVVLEGRLKAQVARDYNVSKSWVSKLIARPYGPRKNKKPEP
jgi:transposase